MGLGISKLFGFGFGYFYSEEPYGPGPGYMQYTSVTDIDILVTRSSPHKGTAIAAITFKMITEMA